MKPLASTQRSTECCSHTLLTSRFTWTLILRSLSLPIPGLSVSLNQARQFHVTGSQTQCMAMAPDVFMGCCPCTLQHFCTVSFPLVTLTVAHRARSPRSGALCPD